MVRIPSRKLRPTKIQFFCQKLKNGEAIESLLVDESDDRKCYKVDNMSIFILREKKKFEVDISDPCRNRDGNPFKLTSFDHSYF